MQYTLCIYQRHKCVLYSTYIRDITAHILTTVFRTSKNPREDIYDLLNTSDKLDFFKKFSRAIRQPIESRLIWAILFAPIEVKYSKILQENLPMDIFHLFLFLRNKVENPIYIGQVWVCALT
jgi:hypothetical protein